MFRQRLTDAARKLKLLAKDIGSHIDKSRPYFEAVNQAKKVRSIITLMKLVINRDHNLFFICFIGNDNLLFLALYSTVILLPNLAEECRTGVCVPPPPPPHL